MIIMSIVISSALAVHLRNRSLFLKALVLFPSPGSSSASRQAVRFQISSYTTAEIQKGRILIFKWIQDDNYKTKLNCLRANTSLKQSSKIISPNPFVDKEELLRAGCRLKNSSLYYGSKYPIILLYNHRVSLLIILKAQIYTLNHQFRITSRNKPFGLLVQRNLFVMLFETVFVLGTKLLLLHG